MSRQLFGTDGIRGTAGEFPLDPPTAFAAGAALGKWAARLTPRPQVVVGIDPRESSPDLAAQVAGGLVSEGAHPHFAGLITTPGVAYLARAGEYVAGVMISASHNQYQDNGIKIFDHSGCKLPDDLERLLEDDIFARLNGGIEAAPVRLAADASLAGRYVDYLASTFPFSLGGVRMVIDCANGAASQIGPELFERLGAVVHRICCAPDGRNINLGCGALHSEALSREVTARGYDLGVALDGDGDRAVLVSRSGRILNGDAVLLLAARFLLGRNRLPGPGGKPAVVATVMSNLGLEEALERHGIRLLRTDVGDKYVLEEMLRSGAALGGEQSGHVIFSEYSTTGDGLLTSLRVLEAMLDSGRGLDELAGEFRLYPQRLVNVPVAEKKPIENLDEVTAEIQAARNAFGACGRILVRYSGTEPLARVMVEGADAAMVEEFSARISAAIRKVLGA